MRCLKSVLVIGVFAFIVFSFAGTSEAKKGWAQTRPLEEVDIFLEVNATDGDAEVVIKVESEEAIRRMTVRDPSGRAIVDVKSKDRVKLGLAEILVESAEPNIDAVLAAYPEGTYEVKVRTVDGGILVGTAELSHDILPAPNFTMTDVEGGVLIEWDPVPGAVRGRQSHRHRVGARSRRVIRRAP